MKVFFNVPWRHQTKDQFHIATCDLLDLQTTGFTQVEAKDNLKQEILLFLEAAHQMKTLPKILSESGWVRGVAGPGEAGIVITEERPQDLPKSGSDEVLYVTLPIEYLQTAA